MFPPTGTVTFLSGSNTLGTGTLSGGVATFTTSSLATGSNSITAVYAGNTTDAGSSSTAISQVVNKEATLTTLASSLNPSIFGQLVTFTATVSAQTPGTGAPTGTVTFLSGPTTLGTGTLSSGVATLSTSSLAAGSFPITAVYGGDTNNAGSTSTVTTQVVSQDASATTLASSLNPSKYGQSVTFTATVSALAPWERNSDRHGLVPVGHELDRNGDA